MKKTVLIITVIMSLAVLLSLATAAQYDSGVCGESITWEYDASTQTLTLSGTGDMNDYPGASVPWAAYTSSIKCVNVSEGITRLGDFAFCGLTALKQVNLPSSLTEIGVGAFALCESLEEIALPNGVCGIEDAAFSGCKSLQNVTLPSSVETIGRGLFENCGMLQSVALNEGIAVIPYGCFASCTSLVSIELPASIVQIDEYAFKDCESLESITIGKSLSNISNSAFVNCAKIREITLSAENTALVLENNVMYDSSKSYIYAVSREISGEIVIPGTVTSIPAGAFMNCNKLEGVILSNGTVEIGGAAFWKCTALSAIEIAQTVETIGDYAFYDCDALRSIRIPDRVESIGESVLYGCDSLEAVTIPFVGKDPNGNKTPIFGYLFGAYDVFSQADMVPDSIKTVVVTGGKIIGGNAFSSCASIESITLPASAEKISQAFVGCSSLTTLVVDASNPYYYVKDNCLIHKESGTLVAGLRGAVIPDDGTIRKIGADAFYAMSDIVNLVIPYGVEEIGIHAFMSCNALETLQLPSTLVTIDEGAFFGCKQLKELNFPSSIQTVKGNAFWQGEDVAGYESVGIEKVTIDDLAAFCNVDFVHGNANPLYYGAKLYLGEELVTEISFPEGTTHIKPYLFYGCSSIESIVLPDSVEKIDQYAFAYMLNLRSVSIPHGVKEISQAAFASCLALESVALSETVEVVGWCAFESCQSIKELHIPSSVVKIEQGAFQRCASLETITVDPNNTVYYGINNCIVEKDTGVLVQGCKNSVIPNDGTIKEIGVTAFSGCTGLTQIVLPDGLVAIRGSAFDGCTGITYLEIPDSVETIDSYAFKGLNALTCVTLPHSLTSLDSLAFNRCFSLFVVYNNSDLALSFGNFYDSVKMIVNKSGEIAYAGDYYFENDFLFEKTGEVYTLISYIGQNPDIVLPRDVQGQPYKINRLIGHFESVVIPSGVTEISDFAFADCIGLRTVVLPDGLISIGESAFMGCSALREILMPDTVTTIGPSAFSGCVSLEKVILSNQLTEIPYAAFRDCRAIKEIVLPDGITIVGTHAFKDCTALCSVVLPDGLSVIDTQAFENCKALTSIDLPASLTRLGSEVFKNSSVTLVKYRASLWEWTFTAKPEWDGGMLAYTFVPTHIFEAVYSHDANGHWYACRGCSEQYGYSAHDFENSCDNLCDTCGYMRSTTHTVADAVRENYFAPTCMGSGSCEMVVYCEVCRVELSREYMRIDELGHDWGAWQQVTVPTCTLEGRSERSCSRCSVVEYDYSPANGHTATAPIEEGRVEATCLENGGYYLTTSCSVCQVVLSREYYVLWAEGHDMTEWYRVADPTCEVDGWNQSDCRRCEYYQTERVYAYGHLSAEAVKENYFEPTCTLTGGYDEVVYCTRCTQELSRTFCYTASLGHDMGEWYLFVAPTCIGVGQNRSDCSRCAHYDLDFVPENGHVPSDAVRENAIEPTCTQAGGYETVVYCAVCREELSREYTGIAPKGHAALDAIVENEVAPTCTECGGYDAVTYCSVCHAEMDREYCVIDALGHDKGEWLLIREPSCTVEGEKHRYCNRCNEVDIILLPANDHVESAEIRENEVQSTCTMDGGYDVVVYCTTCGEQLARNHFEVAASGHAPSGTSQENYVEPTCTQPGGYDAVVYCRTCQEELSRMPHSIPALGHSYVIEVIAPTCTEQGYTTYLCSCGDTRVEDHIPAYGHTPGEWIVEIEPQEGKQGVQSVYCAVCFEKMMEEIIPPLPPAPETETEVVESTQEIHTDKPITDESAQDQTSLPEAEKGADNRSCNAVIGALPLLLCLATAAALFGKKRKIS